jgi:hypothetical protein
MSKVFVESSNIESVSYSDAERILQVAFQNGRTYNYRKVPLNIAAGLVFAESPGRFLNKEVKPKFEFEEV